MARKICVVTGSRAEYGLLKTLINLLHNSTELTLQLIVTGAHLSKEFGYSIEVIKQDGFRIDHCVECIPRSDTYSAMANSIGLGLLGFTEALEQLQPDGLVILGDRFEIFAAAQAAYCLKIPIAHIHGGELTEGAQDEGFRHAISKLSHLHFVSHEVYGKRLKQLGENPEHVYVCGAPGLDLIVSKPRLSKEALSHLLGFSLENYFLITLHPCAFDAVNGPQAATLLLEALNSFPDMQMLITGANVDPQGRAINHVFIQAMQQETKRIKWIANLSEDYFSAIEHCTVVIGNSSSGVIEIPYFEKMTVNIGKRQQGRILPRSVIQAEFSKQAIVAAIHQALTESKVLMEKPKENLYGIPGKISHTIYEQLTLINMQQLKGKQFYDI